MSLVEITKDAPYPQCLVFGLEIEGYNRKKGWGDGRYAVQLKLLDTEEVLTFYDSKEYSTIFGVSMLISHFRNPTYRPSSKVGRDFIKENIPEGSKLESIRVDFENNEGKYIVKLLRIEEAYPER